jgi:hypothetical protein
MYMGDENPEGVPIELQPRIKTLFEGTFPYKMNDTEAHLPIRYRSFLPYEVKDTNSYISSPSTLIMPAQLYDGLDGGNTAAHIVSLGCDSVCVIGLEEKLVAVRLRSGDVMRFSGPSLKAWYGVAKVFEGTSPDLISDDRLWSETAKGPWPKDIQEFIKDKTVDLTFKGTS